MTSLATWIKETEDYVDACRMKGSDLEVRLLYKDALKILSNNLGGLMVDLPSAGFLCDEYLYAKKK